MEPSEDLEARLLALVAELAGEPPPAPVLPETRLDDVGFDSLSYADLALAAEERLGLTLPEDGVKGLETVSDLVALGRMARAAEEDDGDHRLAGRIAAEELPRGIGRIQRSSRRFPGPLVRRRFRLTIEGAEHMPAEGPVVLCMNHESWTDIPVAVVASPRRITFMAKRELFRKRFGAFMLRELGGFQVDRDAFDLHAIRLALTVLGRGEVLGMYPEGTRSPGVLLPFLDGAAWLALKTGAPLLPMALVGTERATPPGVKVPKRVPIEVRFDPPIEVAPVDDPVKRRAEAGDLTARLRDAFVRLLGRD